MIRYILKRLLLGIIVLFGVVSITFLIARVIPSNAAAKWAGTRATPAQIEAAKIELGLDKPLYIQYIRYINDLLHGNLGKSLRTHQPILTELKTYVPATLELVLFSFIYAALIGIPLGIYSAKYKDKLLDHISRFISIGNISIPTFWLGLLLQLFFFKKLHWFPLGGRVSTEMTIFDEMPNVTGFLLIDSLIKGRLDFFWDGFVHLILPSITIALYPMGMVARMTRSALLEVLNEDYIVAARTYGLSEKEVLWHYAFKNTVGPTATVLALSMGYTLVGTYLTETIFSWPGIGNYVSTAVTTLDYPAIIGVTLFSAVSYVILNLIADIIIAIDPRVRVK